MGSEMCIRDSIDENGIPTRALVDVTQDSIKRAKTPLGAHLIAAHFCGSIWTRSRAAKSGLEIDSKCELCGLCEDTVAHRFSCTAPQVTSAKATMPRRLARWLDAGENFDTLWDVEV